MLIRLCKRHLDTSRRQLERFESAFCPTCLFDELRSATDLVRAASERIRRLEGVRAAAQRFREDPVKGGKLLEEALAACRQIDEEGEKGEDSAPPRTTAR
jgi:hypothetical protein